MKDAVSLILRRELPEERSAIRAVNEAAFGRPDEADLVDRLRSGGAMIASFVAEREAQVVGHILFSRILLETASASIPAVALAPMAVLPAQQRRGVGGQLIRHGLDWLQGQGERIVTVLGHPRYYPRFGFSSDRARALASPFPAGAFMALELVPSALDGVRGVVRYPEAFQIPTSPRRDRL
jgi:putative acetyltransferase